MACIHRRPWPPIASKSYGNHRQKRLIQIKSNVARYEVPQIGSGHRDEKR